MDIPVIGWAMKLAKHVFLKRDDIRSTLEVTDSCVERVRTYFLFYLDLGFIMNFFSLYNFSDLSYIFFSNMNVRTMIHDM